MSVSIRSLAAAVVVVTSASLTGCASGPKYHGMDPAARAKVNDTRAVTAVVQPEITVEAPPPSYAGGGLIGALITSAIDNSRTKSAEQTVTPLRNSLLDYDYDAQFQAGVQATLAKADWLHVDKSEFTKDANNPSFASRIVTSDTPYIMFVTENYHISHDMMRITVNGTASLFAKPAAAPAKGGKAADDFSNAVYWVPMVYTAVIPDDTIDEIEKQAEAAAPKPAPGQKAAPDMDDDQAAIKYWSDDKGAKAKEALNQAIADIDTMLLQALQSPYTPGTVPATVKMGNLQGHIVSQNGGRAIVQFENGTLESLPMDDIKFISAH